MGLEPDPRSADVAACWITHAEVSFSGTRRNVRSYARFADRRCRIRAVKRGRRVLQPDAVSATMVLRHARRSNLRLSVVVALSLAVASCGSGDGGSDTTGSGLQATPAVTTTTPVPPTTTATVTTTSTTSTTTAAITTTTLSPGAANLVGDGLGLVSFGDPADQALAIILTALGGPLDEPEITTALLDSVEWLQFAELAPEGLFSPQAGGFVDLFAYPWSPEASELGQATLAEVGMDVRIVIANADDEELFGIAQRLFTADGALAGLQLVPPGGGVDIEAYGGLEEAQRISGGYAKRGIPVVLLYRAEG